MPQAPQFAAPLPLIGRESLLGALTEELLAHGLVTLVGPAGVGKTALARALVASGSYPETRWCDLSAVRAGDAAGVALAVAGTLGATRALPRGADPAMDPLVDSGWALASLVGASGRVLVVVDQAEHVAGVVHALVAGWRSAAPLAHVLITSRRRLGLGDEVVLSVPPLEARDAEALFVARAPAPRELPGPDRARLPELLARLDGLPLAIELAASRFPVCSVAAQMEQIGVGSPGLAAPALHAALAWSWALLTPEEQSALAQLTVFRGRISLDAVEAVVDVGEAGPVDALRALVEHHLVVQQGPERFGLLASVRSFVVEEADPSLVDVIEAAAARHAAWYARFGEGLEHLPDLLAAHDHGVRAAKDGPDGAAIAVDALCAANVGLRAQGSLARIGELAAATIELDGLSAAQKARVEHVWGSALLYVATPDEAEPHLRQAMAHAREVGDPELVGRGLCAIGEVEDRLGRGEDAIVSYRTAVDVLAGVEHEAPLGEALMGLGATLHHTGRLEEAEQTLRRALEVHVRLGNQRAEAVACNTLGVVYRQRGRTASARTALERSLALAIELGEQASACVTLVNLGALEEAEGDFGQARARYEEGLALADSIGDRLSVCVFTGNLGHLATVSGAPGEASVWLEAALAMSRSLGQPRYEGIWLGMLGALCRQQGRRDEALTWLGDALAVLRDAGVARYEAAYRVERGHAWLGADADAARRDFEAARGVADEMGLVDVQLEARLGLAIALGRLGRPAEAVLAAEGASEVARGGQDTGALVRAEVMAAWARALGGDRSGVVRMRGLERRLSVIADAGERTEARIRGAEAFLMHRGSAAATNGLPPWADRSVPDRPRDRDRDRESSDRDRGRESSDRDRGRESSDRDRGRESSDRDRGRESSDRGSSEARAWLEAAEALRPPWREDLRLQIEAVGG